uniref:SLC41A/MgtE integral membrane domain-containing protein n=1 Tax=Pyrodinium bahamense TaxID=73915 RepID=A0A7S0F8F1_9DINO
MAEAGELVSVVENTGNRVGDHHTDGHMECDASAGTSEVRCRSGTGIRKPATPWAEGGDLRPCGDCEEVADSASLHKFWHRAGWLVLLLMCQSTSSVILEHFELLIKSHPVVIYFLTMLVGAGGNAGGQSTVLVVRRLALAAVGGRGHANGDPGLSVRRIVGSELSVGAQLSVVLCCASFVRCIVFQVRGVECLAICLSMLVIVFTSTLAGAALPLLLRRLNVDPAHAGATIQVVMDISGVTLTCVVSCLVLGLPLSGKAGGKAVVAAGSNSRIGPGLGISIQRETSHGLNAFGMEAASVDSLR